MGNLIKGMIVGVMIGVAVGTMINTDDMTCLAKKYIRKGKRILNSMV